MDLVHCIYCSAATNAALTPAELDAILEVSRTNNAKAGITGMLLYQDGSFFQILEGDRAVVAALYDKIGCDKRHARVTKIVLESIEQRAFGEWTMGYPRVSRAQLAEIPGLNDFFTQRNSFMDLGEGRAKTLLAAFSEGRWRATIL